MAFVFKPITPKALNQNAVYMALLAGGSEAGTGIKKDFEKTTRTWKGAKPRFEMFINLAQAKLLVFVGVVGDDEGAKKFAYVSEGTRAHLIFPGAVTGKSSKKALRFKGTFRAKTQPGIIGSGAGFSGGKTVVAKAVRHPGTKARKFDQAIQKKWRGPFKADMQKAMKNAAKASGHGR